VQAKGIHIKGHSKKTQNFDFSCTLETVYHQSKKYHNSKNAYLKILRISILTFSY